MLLAELTELYRPSEEALAWHAAHPENSSVSFVGW